MNHTLETLLLDYFTRHPVSQTSGRRNQQHQTSQRTTFHGRQMESQHIQSLSNVMNTYNQNMTTYQNNLSLYLHLMDEMHRSHSDGLPSSSNRSPNYLESIFQNYYYPRNRQTNAPRANSLLTNSEIQRNTRRFVYSLSGERLFDVRCPISLEDFQEGDQLCQIVGCGHVFKHSHLISWFSRNTRCPVCRYNLLDPPSATNTNASGNTQINPTTGVPQPIGPTGTSNLQTLVNAELNNPEIIQEIANIFNDFMSNPSQNRSYALDTSGNETTYLFDFTMY
jgi:hypothetical protein